MTDLISALRDEIRKQSRKELRAALDKTKKLVANHRREIAKLKKQLQAADKRIAFLEGRERKRLAASKHVEPQVVRRFSPKSVRTHRNRIGFSAGDYGQLLGVTAQTVYLWEGGKSRPGKPQLAALAKLRSIGKKEARERLRILQAASDDRTAE